MSASSRVVTIDEPAGGWFVPWPNVFELSRALPADRWVLVGGLMVPDHAGPAATRRLRGRPMFEAEGGTQALGRTMANEMQTGVDGPTRITVPDELGALVLKGAAYAADSRNRVRHLQDAAVLAACITDHATELGRMAGSDRKRLRMLAKALSDSTHPAWLVLDSSRTRASRDTLRILSGE